MGEELMRCNKNSSHDYSCGPLDVNHESGYSEKKNGVYTGRELQKRGNLQQLALASNALCPCESPSWLNDENDGTSKHTKNIPNSYQSNCCCFAALLFVLVDTSQVTGTELAI